MDGKAHISSRGQLDVDHRESSQGPIRAPGTHFQGKPRVRKMFRILGPSERSQRFQGSDLRSNRSATWTSLGQKRASNIPKLQRNGLRLRRICRHQTVIGCFSSFFLPSQVRIKSSDLISPMVMAAERRAAPPARAGGESARLGERDRHTWSKLSIFYK